MVYQRTFRISKIRHPTGLVGRVADSLALFRGRVGVEVKPDVVVVIVVIADRRGRVGEE